MASIYDKSSLVLIPSGTKTGKIFSQKPVSGDGDFTFTRASAATRVNADGNIEKETQNLLQQSNTFNTTWGSNNVTLSSGQGGYDGSSDAWLLTATGSTARLEQSVSSNLNVFSIYAKAGTTDGIALRIIGGTNPYIYWNLNDGSFVGTSGGGGINPSNQQVTDVGGGWYRIQITTASAITAMIYVSDSAGNLVTSGNIYIQDAQLEQGLVARDVITTTTAAVYGGITDNTPRLDYTDSSCPALLLEPQRTNLLPHSEYFNGGFSGSFETNAAISPDGTMNASKFVFTQGASYPQFYTFLSGLVVGQQYTSSIYIKKTEASEDFQMISSGVSFIPTDEWQRVVRSFTATATSQSVLVNYVPSVGVGVINEVYVAFAQVEAGSYATSYIPTYGSSVSRVNEFTYKYPAQDLIGQAEGTMYAECIINGIKDNNTIFSVSNGSFSEYLVISGNGSGNVNAYIFAGGVQQVGIISGVYGVGDVLKCAFSYKENDVVYYINGIQIGTDTSANMASTSQVDIGNLSFFNAPLNGSVKQTLLFKTRLSNEELAALTTI
jgi:hypothetical protein